MSENVKVAVSRRSVCGEGPTWHPPSNSIYWVDIVPGEILRTDLDSLTTRTISFPEMVGAAAPRVDGGIVAAVATGFAGFDATGEVDRSIACLPDGVRMNDAKVDPAGRYWAGSCALDFESGKGSLWLLDEDWRAHQVLDQLTQPNGLGWSPNGTVFYLVETQARIILSFDFDPVSSAITSAPRVLVDSDSFTGFPDGLAVDTEGNLWVAEFGGGSIHKFTAAGNKVTTFPIPTQQPTSCAFVGPALDELWVTSAAAGLTEQADPLAGSIFQVQGHGATGLPVAEFRG